MYAWIQHLAVQQTTAPELATFLVLATVACVLAAMLAYTTIMTVAWATTLRARKWKEVVIPSMATFKKNWPGYGLAILTSTVLALTLAAKDSLVDDVLSRPASTYVDSPMFARLFPLGRVPTGADMGTHRSLNEAVKAVTEANLADLVRAPLAAGRAEGVRSILLAAAREAIDTQSPVTLQRIELGLKIACFAGILGYVLSITWNRIKVLLKPDGESPELEEGIGQRLVVLGVCLALLLANPLHDPTPELIADSALATARISPVHMPKLDSLANRGIAGQTNTLIAGTMSLDAIARRQIVELSKHVTTFDTVWSVLDRSSRAGAAALDAERTRLDAERARLDRERARLDALALALDSIGKRSLLLVVAGAGQTFAVQGSSLNTKGIGAGLYWVAPGKYVATNAFGGSQGANVRSGEHVAVLLQGRGGNVAVAPGSVTSTLPPKSGLPSKALKGTKIPVAQPVQ